MIPAPKIADLTYRDLVDLAMRRRRETCPDWTDESASDPGVTLIEVFAFLAETLVYRMNRIPDRVHAALLNLLGIEPRPPAAAAALLSFTRSAPGPDALDIPAGTAAAAGTGDVVFRTIAPAVIPAGKTQISVAALACELVDGELLGVGNGSARQSFVLKRPPVIAPTGDGLDFVLGVEERGPGPRGAGARREYAGKVFRVWTATDDFVAAGADAEVYALRRSQGLVAFAPSRGADDSQPACAVPAPGAEIRIWYRRGGGRAGNVRAGSVTQLKTALPGVAVTNPEPAAGGADAETLESVLRRAPFEARGLRAAVTARDFERVALSVGGIARARAEAYAETWKHGPPGVVRILIVPDTGGGTGPPVSRSTIEALQTETLRTRAARAVETGKPLGVRTQVTWARYREVGVSARVVLALEEDTEAARRRILARLDRLTSPYSGREFGQALRASDVYEAILAEPGVRFCDQVRLRISDAPAAMARDIMRDWHQPRGWHAAAADGLYRSLDDGESWTRVFAADNVRPRRVRPCPFVPGLLAILADTGPDGEAAEGVIAFSEDCGETWSAARQALDARLFDAAWARHDGTPVLIVAGRRGLFRVRPDGATPPAPIAVDPADPGRGFFAVAAAPLVSGATAIACAAQQQSGVYVSVAGGSTGSFGQALLKGKDVRTLAFNREGGIDMLWAGFAAAAGAPGEGAARAAISASGVVDPGFATLNLGWDGGSCLDFAFGPGAAYAASNRGGVASWPLAAAEPRWRPLRADSGLPLRAGGRDLAEVAAVAASEDGRIVLAAGDNGTYRSADGARRFASAAETAFADRLPMPPEHLPVPGTHDIAVIADGTSTPP